MITHHLYYSAEKRERILGIKVRSKEKPTRISGDRLTAMACQNLY